MNSLETANWLADNWKLIPGAIAGLYLFVQVERRPVAFAVVVATAAVTVALWAGLTA